MVVNIRKRNIDGLILAIAESELPNARLVGKEGKGESVVSIDDDVWNAGNPNAKANGRWYLTGDARVVESRYARAHRQEDEVDVEESVEVIDEHDSEHNGHRK